MRAESNGRKIQEYTLYTWCTQKSFYPNKNKLVYRYLSSIIYSKDNMADIMDRIAKSLNL